MTETKMTEEMRRALSARMEELNARIRSLEEDVEEAIDNLALARQLGRERDQIADALAGAVLIENTPFDTHAIEIGDVVAVRSQHGIVERFVLVDGRFASRLRDDWVSVSSPMGHALLGRGVGDEIEVATPNGTSRYVIVSFERSGGAAERAETSHGTPAA